MALLTKRERYILGYIQHRADAQIGEIANALRLREHVVRYTIAGLIDSKVILARTPFLNLYPLGLRDFVVYFNLAIGGKERRKDSVAAIAKQVSWLARIGGNYEFALSIPTKRPEELLELFDKISTKNRGTFGEKYLSIIRIYTAFGRKYLADSRITIPQLSFGSSGQELVIDALDFKILSAMSKGGFDSGRDLAKRLNLQHTTLERRVKRLEIGRIIQGYIYRLNLQALEVQTTRLLIFSRSIDPSFAKKLFNYAQKNRFVLKFIQVIGAHDYELEIETDNNRNLIETVEEIKSEFAQEISSIRTIQIFEHLAYRPLPDFLENYTN